MSDNLEFELYKIKSETFRFYCSHYRYLVLLYLSTIGAILNFSLTPKASDELFFSLMIIGVIFTMIAEVARWIHHDSVNKLEKSISILAEKLSLVGHEDDCKNFSKILWLLACFNLVVF